MPRMNLIFWCAFIYILVLCPLIYGKKPYFDCRRFPFAPGCRGIITTKRGDSVEPIELSNPLEESGRTSRTEDLNDLDFSEPRKNILPALFLLVDGDKMSDPSLGIPKNKATSLDQDRVLDLVLRRVIV